MGRGRAIARNLVQPVTARFFGDPAGAALTRATFDHDAPGMSGRAGHVYVGEKGCAERTFNGYAHQPQPILDGTLMMTVRQGTPALFSNGPSDYSSLPSSADGELFTDARYRALATKAMMR